MLDGSRSKTMRAVRSCNTKPEIAVRKLVHSLGCRFRLHSADLAGRPDIVLPKRKAVIFVHGCFWHGHTCKRGARQPKTNSEYWIRKIAGNVARDHRVANELTEAGWAVHIVWECELKHPQQLEAKLREALCGPTQVDVEHQAA